MFLNVIFIILGFALLIKGADFLVDGSSGIAKKFHIPEIVIGLTIVSIGTSMPELFVSITSSLEGYQDMAIGNVIGSNLCNLLLVLGLAATISPVMFKRETKLIEIPMCLGITIIFLVLANIGQGISRVDGIILITLFVVFIVYTIFMAKKGGDFDSKDEPLVELKTESKKTTKPIINILKIVVGIIALKFGGDFVVNNAEEIAHIFNISEKIISLTIIAIGTSLPELVTSVIAAIKGDSDIAIGNIIGSNIFNMLLIIGAPALMKPITYNMSYNLEMAILVIATVVLGIFPYTDKKNEMTRSNGITYLMLYALYMVVLFVK